MAAKLRESGRAARSRVPILPRCLCGRSPKEESQVDQSIEWLILTRKHPVKEQKQRKADQHARKTRATQDNKLFSSKVSHKQDNGPDLKKKTWKPEFMTFKMKNETMRADDETLRMSKSSEEAAEPSAGVKAAFCGHRQQTSPLLWPLRRLFSAPFQHLLRATFSGHYRCPPPQPMNERRKKETGEDQSRRGRGVDEEPALISRV